MEQVIAGVSPAYLLISGVQVLVTVLIFFWFGNKLLNKGVAIAELLRDSLDRGFERLVEAMTAEHARMEHGTDAQHAQLEAHMTQLLREQTAQTELLRERLPAQPGLRRPRRAG